MHKYTQITDRTTQKADGAIRRIHLMETAKVGQKQEERFTRKEYYKIGLEEIRENNHLKSINIIEHSKIVNAVSIGLIFTTLRFQELFNEIAFPWSLGFLLPITTILFNMAAFYPSQKAFDLNEEKIKRIYHRNSRTADLIENRVLNWVHFLEVFSHISFWLNLLFAGYLLYTIFGG